MYAGGFYTMMQVVPPLRNEFFLYQETYTGALHPVQSFWSWLVPPDERMKHTVAYLQSIQWIRKYIPGVQSVYLADQITFNDLKEDSVIGLFVITTKKRVRLTKCFVDISLWMMNFLSQYIKHGKKMRVSFFITEDKQDLSGMMLTPSDPCLVYRLAHLVPWYHRDAIHFEQIYEANSWITYYLPNFPCCQTIFLGIDISLGTSVWKRRREVFVGSVFGSILEKGIYMCKHAYFKRKKRRSPLAYAHVIVSPYRYKSHDDKRKRYALQREVFKKTYQEKDAS